jgi:hypothetical protein
MEKMSLLFECTSEKEKKLGKPTKSSKNWVYWAFGRRKLGPGGDAKHFLLMFNVSSLPLTFS